MADKVGGIYVDLELKKGQFERDLQRTERDIKNSSQKISTSFKEIALAAGGALAAIMTLRKAVVVLKDLEANARSKTLAYKTLTNQIKSMGRESEMTMPSLARLAGELQEISNFGDDEIMREAISSLMKFRSISGDAFKRAATLAVDMASVNGSLANSAQLVGRALEQPLEAITLLRRQGIVFNQMQKEQIENFIQTSQLAKAQEVMFKALEGIYSGMARTVAEPMKQLKNAFGDLKTELGFGLVEATDSFAAKLLPVVNSAVEYFQAMRMSIKDVGVELESLSLSQLEEELERVGKQIETIEKTSGLLLFFKSLGKAFKETLKDYTNFDKQIEAILAEQEKAGSDPTALDKKLKDWALGASGSIDKINQLKQEQTEITEQLNKRLEEEASLQKDNTKLLRLREELMKDSAEFGKKTLDALEREDQALRKLLSSMSEFVTQTEEEQDLTELFTHKMSYNWDELRKNIQNVTEQERDFALIGRESIEDIKEAWDEYLVKLKSIYGEESREYELAMEKKNISLEEFNEKVRKFSDDALDAMRDLSRAIGNNMVNALTDVITGAENAQQAFSRFTKAVLSDMARMIAQLIVFKTLQAGLSALFPGSSFVSKLFFNQGGVVGLNSGGIVAANSGAVMDNRVVAGSPANQDSVLAYLTKGERVMNRSASMNNSYLLDSLNANPMLLSNIGGNSINSKLDNIANILRGKDFSPSVIVRNEISATDVNRANSIGRQVRGGF